MPPQPVEVFFSYSHRDEKLRDELETHLAMLKREGVIRGWHDRKITAGKGWDGKIRDSLNSADIILLLVSPDFLASDYCYDNEVSRAMERNDAGEACVIPVILRPCDWTRAPFSALQALPKNAKAVTRWKRRDDAFLDVAEGIRRAAQELLSGREARTETPGATPKVATSSNIPQPPVFGFVSRRDAQGRDIVGRLREELAPGRNQPVTLSGPGGIGKTTLAAEAARELLAAYDGRITWSSADGRTDFTLLSLLDDISTQFGHPDLRTLAPDKKEEQARALVANAPALVVLDNYETVAAGEQRHIEAWFRSARCSALFTSRHKIKETILVQVSAMSRGEAEEFLEKLAGQTQDPQMFTAEVRRRVYETAEANPSVMQWIGGQIDEAREPNTVFEELAQGEGDAAERVFDRSFNLPQLGDEGRDTLLALSLFAPSASREALAEVVGFGCNRKRLDDAVKNLYALWLIKGLDVNRRLAVEGLTRTMAAARLSKDQRADEFRRRFIAYFLRYATEHEKQTPENYDAMDIERDNLLGTVDAAFAMQDWKSVMLIRAALEDFLFLHGYWDEAIRSSKQAEEAALKEKDDFEVARFTGNVALIRINRGEYEEAKRAYRESLESLRKLGSDENVATCLLQLGNIAYFQNDIEEARRLYDESLEINRNLNNQRGIALTVWNIGSIVLIQGDADEAKKLFTEALDTFISLKDLSNTAGVLNQLALVAQKQGDLGEARRLFSESLEIKKKLGDYSINITLRNLGLIAEKEGNKMEASRLFREALRISEKLGSPLAETAREDLARVGGSP